MSRRRNMPNAYWELMGKQQFRERYFCYLQENALEDNDVNAQCFSAKCSSSERNGMSLRDSIEFLCGYVPPLFD